MKKNKIYYLLIALLFTSILNSQPYYYSSNRELIDSTSNYISDIYRVNMNNPIEIETILTGLDGVVRFKVDENGNWMAFVENEQLTIMSINNHNDKNIIANNSGSVIKLSFAQAINKLIAVYNDNSNGLFNMNLVDLVTLTISDSIPYDICWECFIDEAVILSKSGDIMYMMKTDTLLQKGYIASYSLSSKQIIATKYIGEIATSGSDEFLFNFRRNGLSVIESLFLSPNPTSYFRIYYLDKDSLSIPILRDDSQTWADGYVANDGKYLLLFATLLTTDSLNLKPTGKIDIYDMTDGTLKKTVQLPPNGEVVCFENYPNNVYYAIDIDLPARQIYNLKMDSILNVLDLASLSPATKVVNSPPFTLTVNGHGFDTLSTVYFNGGAKTTTYISDSVLTASISTADISVVGNYTVWVMDEWGTSDTLMFAVTPQPADLSSLSPAIALTYDPLYELEYFTITVNGSNFNSSSVIYFGGYARTTTFVSSTVLTFQGRSYDVGVNAHTIPLWVSNGGAISDTLTFSVQTNNALIEPVFSCIVENGREEFTAHLGYINSNSAAVFIPIGSKNQFWPSPQDRGQPKIFLPGSNLESFTIDFDGSEISWQFATSEATFSGKSDQCE